MNVVEEGLESDRATIHSGVEDLNDHIPIAEALINKYLTQIYLVKTKDHEIITKHKRYKQIFITEE